ncbi:hypothetical protein [Kribbella sp. NPDC051620]|uniref:hypothetical protein n=1 Tax=Kribbella sp. NPDC051620 TaxID=3364120 RepID=UPI0037B728FD
MAAEEPAVERGQLHVLVRFALSQLLGRNEHHRFEHLCTALARQRITPNIVAGTGPVSSGGDQGRDFETFIGYMPGRGRDLASRLGIDGSDTIVFCCTLGRTDLAGKIRRDIARAVSIGSTVDAVVYFAEQDIPTATRHQLIQEANDAHHVRLEILDGQTLTGLLCDRDTFWIAVEFLDIPAYLAPPNAGPEWYEDSHARWLSRTTQAATAGDLMELTGCLRFATFTANVRGDVPTWLARLTPLLDSQDQIIRRRARYEIAVATYRGLGDMRPADELVRLTLADALGSESAEELDSAELLATYARGAWMYAATGLTTGELEEFGDGLEGQIAALALAASDPNHACQLYALLGRVRLRIDLRELVRTEFRRGQFLPPPPMSSDEWDELLASRIAERQFVPPVRDARSAMDAWSEAVRLADHAPRFPVESFAMTVALHAASVEDDPRWPTLRTQLDSMVASAAGNLAVAELARTRSSSLLATGRPFAALAELHAARSAMLSGRDQRAGAQAMLDAAAVYRQLGLLYAAKYYALAAGAIAAMERDEPETLVVDSLLLAAQCDFLAGNWFSFIAILPLAAQAHTDLRVGADEPLLWDDTIEVARSLGMVAAVIEEAGAIELAQWLHERLPDDQANETRPAFGQLTRTAPRGGLTEQIVSELGQPPFADGGRHRLITFTTREVRWRIRSKNTYDDVRAAERLAAVIQIIAAVLGEEDLVLAAVTLDIDVRTRRPVPVPPQGLSRHLKDLGRADDGAVLWKATLTRDLGPHSVEFEAAFAEVTSVASALYLSASLLPHDSIGDVLSRIGAGGALARAVMPHIRYDRAYAVLPSESFAQAKRQSTTPFAPAGFGEVLTSKYLSPRITRGPVLTGESPEERTAGRYPLLMRSLEVTLPRLLEQGQMREIAAELRAEGWKDWHILMALFNQIFNHRLTERGQDGRDPALRERIARWEPEDPADLQIDVSAVTAQSLRHHLAASYFATANGYGLAPGALRASEVLGVLETRYGYWTLDADHQDPFPPA